MKQQIAIKEYMAAKFHDELTELLKAGWRVKYLYNEGTHYFWALLERE